LENDPFQRKEKYMGPKNDNPYSFFKERNEPSYNLLEFSCFVKRKNF
jgi:hypothetical protein